MFRNLGSNVPSSGGSCGDNVRDMCEHGVTASTETSSTSSQLWGEQIGPGRRSKKGGMRLKKETAGGRYHKRGAVPDKRTEGSLNLVHQVSRKERLKRFKDRSYSRHRLSRGV